MNLQLCSDVTPIQAGHASKLHQILFSRAPLNMLTADPHASGKAYEVAKHAQEVQASCTSPDYGGCAAYAGMTSKE